MKSKIAIFLRENTLYTNSLYVMTSNMVLIGSGFLFWIIAARLYGTSQIGVATSLYSLLTLLSNLSLLGLNRSLMRFLPAQELKNEKINSSILITVCVSLILTIMTIMVLPELSPSLAFVTHNKLFFIMFVFFTVAQTLNLLIEAILISFREGNQVLIKNVILSIIKLIFPFILLFIGAYGIFSSIELAGVISALYGFVIVAILYKIRYRPAFHKASVKQMSFFAFGNYVSGLASSAPTYILPILITNMLGPTSAAYYYIVGTTSNVLFMVPAAITQNLLVEGSYQEKQIKQHTRKATRLILMILIPGIIAMVLFGNDILLVFGKHYSIEGINLLRLFAISGIFVGFNFIFGTLLAIFHHIKLLIILNSISSVLLLLLSYLFLNHGLVGIGYAAIFAQFILSLMYVVSFYKIGKASLLLPLF